MSLNSLLKNALQKIAPAEADIYEGKEEIYITFHYNSIPADFGDDLPSHERHLIQVHLFAPAGMNTLQKRRDVKSALSQLGTTWPSYTNLSDKFGQHHVFECELAEAAGVD